MFATNNISGFRLGLRRTHSEYVGGWRQTIIQPDHQHRIQAGVLPLWQKYLRNVCVVDVNEVSLVFYLAVLLSYYPPIIHIPRHLMSES